MDENRSVYGDFQKQSLNNYWNSFRCTFCFLSASSIHFYPDIARYISQKTNRICGKQIQKLLSAVFNSPHMKEHSDAMYVGLKQEDGINRSDAIYKIIFA
jgi:hypothetical protein